MSDQSNKEGKQWVSEHTGCCREWVEIREKTRRDGGEKCITIS
jgi:hypothetical protein